MKENKGIICCDERGCLKTKQINLEKAKQINWFCKKHRKNKPTSKFKKSLINLDKINLKTTLSISLIGILLLLFLTNLNPELTNIENINNKLLNQKTQVQGQIFNIRTFEESNFQIISIKDETGKINIILNNPINIKKDQNITVIGKITEYNQTLQIQADKIIINKFP